MECFLEISQSHRKNCPGLPKIKTVLSVKNLGHLALRDLDDLEINFINDLKIQHFSMEDIDLIGIRAAVNQLLNTVCKPKSAIHIPFDIDSIDSLWTPNTGTPVSGGLTFREALQIGEIIAATKRLTVLEIYEVNTELKPTEYVKKDNQSFN
jgi:arginase